MDWRFKKASLIAIAIACTITAARSQSPTCECTYDTWTPISMTNAPVGGVAVWTGSEMIVWSGSTNYGARYDPNTDSWTPISTDNAPSWPLVQAVWTGSEMIVWATGSTGDPDYRGTGARYNLATDT